MIIDWNGRLIDGAHIVEWRKESVEGNEGTAIVIGKTAWGVEVEVERGTEAECDACLAKARAHIEEKSNVERQARDHLRANLNEMTKVVKKFDTAIHKMDRLLAVRGR